MSDLEKLIAAENERHRQAVRDESRILWNVVFFLFGAVVGGILLMSGVVH